MGKKVVFGLGLWVAVWASFWFMGWKLIDPDFGWHLQIGRKFLAGEMVKTDPFSYTMPSFPWIDHGRVTDMAIAFLYDGWGMGVTAAVFAGIGTAALILIIPVGLWVWSVVPLLFGWGVLVMRSGVRPQMEDWLFVAIIWRAVEAGRWKFLRWFLPVLFVIWVNVHGGFLLGLIIVCAGVAGKWWKKRRIVISDVIVWILCLLGTGINYYGFRIWEEIWLTVSDTHLRGSIVEWQPFVTRVELGLWLLGGMVFFAGKKFLRNLSASRLLIVAAVTAAGLSSLRHAPFLVMILVTLGAEIFKNFYDEIKSDKEKVKRAKVFYGVLLGLGLIIFAMEGGVTLWKAGRGRLLNYPDGAIEYLRKSEISGRLFSTYSWGGYLIWKLPEQKVFVDGRMPSWRWKAPEGESDWAFVDHEKIQSGEKRMELFDKYNIKTVLWAKPAEKKGITAWWQKMWGGRSQVGFDEALKSEGWKVVYEDAISVVLTYPVPVDKKERNETESQSG